MIIFRYLAKKVLTTMAAITLLLSLIIMSNQFIWCLNLAASGKIPSMYIIKLMSLEFPIVLWLILPLGYYLALLVTCSQLYTDTEMTALNACGYGPGQLLKHSFMMAFAVAVFALIIIMWLRPWVMTERIKILHSPSLPNFLKTIAPKRFHAIKNSHHISRLRKKLSNKNR